MGGELRGESRREAPWGRRAGNKKKLAKPLIDLGARHGRRRTQRCEHFCWPPPPLLGFMRAAGRERECCLDALVRVRCDQVDSCGCVNT
jgi:hypothetical protein